MRRAGHDHEYARLRPGARRDGALVGSAELIDPPSGVDLEPHAPGEFTLSFEGGLSLRLGAAGEELTLSMPPGARVEMSRGALVVREGRILLEGVGARAPLEVREGRALVQREEPRPGEWHPQLRFYDSAPVDSD